MTEALHVEWRTFEETLGASSSTFIMAGGSSPESGGVASSDRPVRDAGTARNLGIRVTSNGTSASSNFHLEKSQVDGNLTVSIGAGATGYLEDTSNEDSYAATDEMNYSMTSGAGGTIGWELMNVEYDADTNCVTLMGCNAASSTNFAVASTTTFLTVIGGRQPDSDETTTNYEIRAGGTWADFAVRTGTVTRTTDTIIISRVDGGDGNASIATQSGTAWLEDTSNTDAISQGGDINASVTTGTGTGNFNVEKMAGSYITTDGSSVQAIHGNDQRVLDSLTVFWPLRGEMSTRTETEAETQATIRFGCTSKQLVANIERMTGSVTVTFATRINGGTGNQSLVLTSVSRGVDTSNEDTITAADVLNYQISSPVGGTNYDVQYIGVIHEVVAVGGLSIPVAMHEYRQRHQSIM